MIDLASKHCLPCEGGVPPLSASEAEALLRSLEGWVLRDGKLHKTFRFRSFREAMGFVAGLADVAESEGHHPDFCVHYRTVDATIWTHAIGGLSENDFILAAKLDRLRAATA